MGFAREEAEIKQILLPELDQKLQDGLRWFFETLVESARWMRAAWRARPGLLVVLAWLVTTVVVVDQVWAIFFSNGEVSSVVDLFWTRHCRRRPARADADDAPLTFHLDPHISAGLGVETGPGRTIVVRDVQGQAAASGISVGYVLVSVGAKGGRSWTLPRGVSLELLLKRLKGQIASCRQADLQLELTFRRGAVAAQGAKLE